MRELIEETKVSRTQLRDAVGALMTTTLADEDVVVMQTPGIGTQYLGPHGGPVRLKVLRPGEGAERGDRGHDP